MLRPIKKLVNYTTSQRGAKITLTLWILAIVIFSIVAPSAKEYEVNSSEGSIGENQPSELAKEIEKKYFPSDEGLPALLVFHRKGEISANDLEKINDLSEWLASDEKPVYVESSLPFHHFPESVQEQFFSDDGSSLLLNVTSKEGLDSNQTHDSLTEITDKVDALQFGDMQFEITGPAGISADTISLFKNSDFVLMIATVLLIFFILILIYRSPVLAITPLIIAAMVYGLVDRILGIIGKFNWFPIEGQAVSIMLVLLFAVITDYSLFVFSRYREELRKNQSKYGSMTEAMTHVSEPIFFSGGTIFLAMITLFVTIFKPYNHFAPVFSIAVLVIAFAGLTLIPSIFAIMGPKAFWPFVPKVDEKVKEKQTFWGRVGRLVKKYPFILGGSLLVVLLIGALNVPTIKYSFNLLKSFPDDISSRKGFDILEDHYPAGQLAPVTILLESEQEIDANEEFLQKANELLDQYKEQPNINSISPELTEDMISGEADLPRNFLSDDNHAIKFQITLESNPYEETALNTIQQLRDSQETFLVNSGFATSHFGLYIGGQSAEQLDVKDMNQRDTIILFSLVVVLITIVLGLQTRSILLPIIMVGTILMSYVASLGFGWWIFQHFMDFDSISYRLPVYTFIFMVALGIDYNIMLVSRIKELANQLPWKDAIANGVKLTGGVISSAGLILAATFGVLMTQPLQELFLFGFVMALGILLDTFLIRGILLPSILTVIPSRFLIRTTKNRKQSV